MVINRLQMKSLFGFWFSFGVCALFVFCSLGFDIYGQDATMKQPVWPSRYTASYGFELMTDHNGVIIVASIDTTSRAYTLGMRPGMEILGWNTLPIRRKLESMKIKRYRKVFPLLTDDKIKLLLLPRSRPGDIAEVFYMTPTGNNRGISLEARNR